MIRALLFFLDRYGDYRTENYDGTRNPDGFYLCEDKLRKLGFFTGPSPRVLVVLVSDSETVVTPHKLSACNPVLGKDQQYCMVNDWAGPFDVDKTVWDLLLRSPGRRFYFNVHRQD